MKLFTERDIRSLKPRKKEYILSEGHGFVIRVLPTGAKIWMYKYRRDGKTHKLTIGNYPDTSLADARDKFSAARLVVRQGGDPASPPPAPGLQAAPETLTVAKLAEKWLEDWSKEHHTSRVHYNNRKALESGVLVAWGDRPAAEIKRRDVIELLRNKAKTTPSQADNIRKALRSIYDYAVEEELLEYNPVEIKVARTIPSLIRPSRDRVLSEKEIRHLWHAIDVGGGSEGTRRALKLILVTGQRPGEVGGMHSDEIEIGIGKPHCDLCRRCGWWTIPKERMKEGKEQRIYLSALAMFLIGGRKGYICCGFDEGEAALTANTMAYHVRRNVLSTGKEAYYGLPRWTPHDLRRTAGTLINKLGSGNEIMNAILAHSVPGVTGIYNRHTYDAAKQTWLTAWSEYLQQLVAQSK